MYKMTKYDPALVWYVVVELATFVSKQAGRSNSYATCKQLANQQKNAVRAGETDNVVSSILPERQRKNVQI